MPDFTPGPWQLTQFDQGWIIHGSDGELVESVYTGKANANLIAAAPEMYAELEDALKTTYQLEQKYLADGNRKWAAPYTERYERIKALLARVGKE